MNYRNKSLPKQSVKPKSDLVLVANENHTDTSVHATETMPQKLASESINEGPSPTSKVYCNASPNNIGSSSEDSSDDDGELGGCCVYAKSFYILTDAMVPFRTQTIPLKFNLVRLNREIVE